LCVRDTNIWQLRRLTREMNAQYDFLWIFALQKSKENHIEHSKNLLLPLEPININR
jgi:hypothetical protein